MTHVRTTAMCVLALAILGMPAHVLADKNEAPIKISLHPSAESRPALKYRLLPDRVDQIAGNAAVYYGKVKAEENAFFANRELRDNIDRWQKTPLDELVAEKARVPSGGIDFHLDRGARCRFCDWQMPIGDVQFYATLLPEIQESRQFSRILAANARIDIAHKRYNSAIWRFQTNYALGRHVAQSEFIVGGLVGIAICGNMRTQILEFIQQPDSPNLYWALTALPTPLIDMREAIELEAHGLELSYPELGNHQGISLRSYSSREQTHSELWQYPPSRRKPDDWKKLYYAVVADMQKLITGDSLAEDQMENSCQEVFPLAKRYLSERGMDDKRIESMSMHQAALIYMLQTFRDSVDEMTKYYYLPYPDSMAGFDAIMQRYQETIADVPEEFRAADHLVTAIKAAKTAETRLAREIAVLRVCEALRIHGALSNGNLPNQLSDVTEVPIPIDPVTGNPFEYRLEGNTAFLRGPALRGAPLHYEITMNTP